MLSVVDKGDTRATITTCPTPEPNPMLADGRVAKQNLMETAR